MIPEFVSQGGDGAPCPSGLGAAFDLLRHGQLAARHGDRVRAARLLRAALTVDPANVQARLWLAAIAEDPRESVRLLDEVLRRQPGHRRALAGRQWAAERLAAASRPAGPAPFRPHIQLLPEPPRARNPWARLAVCVACLLVLLAGAFAVANHTWAEVSPAPAASGPALLLDRLTYFLPFVSASAPESAGPRADSAAEKPPPTEPPPAGTPVPPTVAPPAETPAPPLSSQPGATLVPAVASEEAADAQAAGGKWIEVVLTKQVAIAWQGNKPVRRMIVSTGTDRYPTVTGRFHIYYKLRSQLMTGPGYRLPNVPSVMYFYRSYALHGTYWHSKFGEPMSHGCVNLSKADAAWLFDWAGPYLPAGKFSVSASASNPGTLVVIHK